jgi:hypothetical protein
MLPWLILLLVAACFLALWLYNRREQARRAGFQDVVADPVFGQLVWQGYGEGDWWQAELTLGEAPVAFCIGGSDRPDPALVAEAHAIAASFPSFRQALGQFLQEQVLHRPAEAEVITSLALTRVVLFPKWADDDPDDYSGTFVVLESHPTPSAALQGRAEWRCEYQEGRFSNLRVWA